MPGEQIIPLPPKVGFNWKQLLVDVVLLNIAFHLAFLLRFGIMVFQQNMSTTGAPVGLYWAFELAMSSGWIVVALYYSLYSSHRTKEKGREVSTVLRALLFLAGVALLSIVAKGGFNYHSRLFLFYFFAIAGIFLILSHVVSFAGTLFPHIKRNVLIIGAGRAGERFYRNVLEDSSIGYHVIGFLDDRSDVSNVESMILGTLGDIVRITDKQKIDEVIIALPNASEEALAELVEICENKLIRVNVIPNDYAALEGRRIVEQVGEFSLVRMREAPLDNPVNKLLKRAFDIFFGLFVLIIIFPPIYIICALLVKFSSPGPIFFEQLRTGEDGANFTCFKFRTMRDQSRENSDSMQATPDDSRLTYIGRIMRRTNIDELPQFWNVVVGDMSVVGPRPHMVKHTEDYKRIINNYMVRHFVKPGVTGWAQINGLRGATELPDKMTQRVKFDIYYIDNWSFGLDLTIIWRTIASMFRGDKNAY